MIMNHLLNCMILQVLSTIPLKVNMDTPQKLNMEPKITQLKRRIIFQTSILGFHVNFPGCPPKISRNSPFPSDQYPVSSILGNRSTTRNPWGFHLTWWWGPGSSLRSFFSGKKRKKPFPGGFILDLPLHIWDEYNIFFRLTLLLVGGRSKIYCLTSCKSHTKDAVTQ